MVRLGLSRTFLRAPITLRRTTASVLGQTGVTAWTTRGFVSA